MTAEIEGTPLASLAARLDSASTAAFVLGGICVFQSGVEALFWVGQALILVAVIGIVVTLVLRRTHLRDTLERLTVTGMFVGIIGMFQPWEITRYEYGFAMLAWSTLAFIIVSHLPSPE